MKKRIYQIKVSIKILMCKILSLLPIKKKSVVAEVNWGNGYGDSPKYIYEQLHKEHPEYQLFWIVKSYQIAGELPHYVKPVLRNSFYYFYIMTTSKIIISNVRLAESFRKRKKQFYIQTWHGFGMKKIEADAIESLSEEYIKKSVIDSKNISLALSNSTTFTNILKNSFWYDGEIVELGFPRNDILVNNKMIEAAHRKFELKYPETIGKKIVLYAPTFRKNKEIDCYNLDIMMVLNQLKKKFGGEFLLLLRLHPNIATLSEKLKIEKDELLDVSLYDDMQELLAISDVLITDYSSSITDFLLTNRPCFIFATDVKSYIADRGFYYSLSSVTGNINESNEELKNSIKNFDNKLFQKNVNIFKENHGIVSADNSAKKIADLISSIN